MKRYFSIFLILFLTFNANAQKKVIISEVDIINQKDFTINGYLLISDKKLDVSKVFGKPDNVKDLYLEMSEIMAKDYIFKDGIEITLANNKLKYFNITSDKYGFSVYDIKVGDSIDGLKSIFPNSYLNIKGNAMALYLSFADYKYVQFVFNKSTRKIISIGFYSF